MVDFPKVFIGFGENQENALYGLGYKSILKKKLIKML